MTSFEKFGESFQTKIIYHMVNDSMFALQILDILEPEFFSTDSLSEISRQIIDWNIKYGTIPTFDNLKTIFKTKIEDDIQREYLVDLIEATSKCADVSDKDFIIEETVKFCKQQAMRNAILQSVELLKREEYGKIHSLVQFALSAGQSKNIGHLYAENSRARTTAKRNPIPTGFPLLDKEYIAGGLSQGEIGIILGGTGAGKSFMLAQLAYSCFVNGGTPVIYSFELQEVPFGLRLDSKISGIPLTKLMLDTDGKHRPAIAKEIEKIRSKFEHKPEIVIKEYPTKSAPLATLKNHLTQLRAAQINPTMIIVDYADLIKPTTRYKEKRHELESIIEELRGWAGVEKLPIWTASQTNRDGLDTSVVTLKTISEALAKAMVADLIISIGRSPRLQEAGKACYYIAKSRLGIDKIAFTGLFDTSCMNFTMDNIGYNEDDLKSDGQYDMNKAVRNVISKVKEIDTSVSGGMNFAEIDRLFSGLED